MSFRDHTWMVLNFGLTPNTMSHKSKRTPEESNPRNTEESDFWRGGAEREESLNSFLTSTSASQLFSPAVAPLKRSARTTPHPAASTCCSSSTSSFHILLCRAASSERSAIFTARTSGSGETAWMTPITMTYFPEEINTDSSSSRWQIVPWQVNKANRRDFFSPSDTDLFGEGGLFGSFKYISSFGNMNGFYAVGWSTLT